MEPEIRSLYDEFQVRQIPVKLFVEKHLFRKKLQLNKNITDLIITRWCELTGYITAEFT